MKTSEKLSFNSSKIRENSTSMKNRMLFFKRGERGHKTKCIRNQTAKRKKAIEELEDKTEEIS